MRNVLTAVGFAIAVFLTGCATPLPAPIKGTPDAELSAKRFGTTPEKARIFVYRNNYLANVLQQELQVNGAVVGTIPGYSFMPLEVPAGKYKLFAKSENETSLDLDVVAGKNYFVQLNASMGVWMFRSELRTVADDEAKKAIVDECKLVLSSVYPFSK